MCNKIRKSADNRKEETCGLKASTATIIGKTFLFWTPTPDQVDGACCTSSHLLRHASHEVMQ